jgi:hypothetical protein
MWYSNLKKKKVFLDIFSSSIDTFGPSYYQYVETCSTEVFSLLPQPLPHLRLNLFVINKSLYESFYATDISKRKQETFLYKYPLHWVILATKKKTTEWCFSVVHT